MTFKDLIRIRVKTIALLLVLSQLCSTTSFAQDKDTLRKKMAPQAFTAKDLHSFGVKKEDSGKLLDQLRKTGARLSSVEDLKQQARSGFSADALALIRELNRLQKSPAEISQEFQKINLSIRPRQSSLLNLWQIRQILGKEDFPQALIDIGFSTPQNQTIIQEIITESLQGLRDEYSYVRRASATALGIIAPLPQAEDQIPQIIPALLQGLRDQDPDVRQASATALGIIAPLPQAEDQIPQIIPALLEGLRDQDWHVRQASATALDRVLSSQLVFHVLINKAGHRDAIEFFNKHFEIVRNNPRPPVSEGSRLSEAKALGEEKTRLSFLKTYDLKKVSLKNGAFSLNNDLEALFNLFRESTHILKINTRVPVVYHLYLKDLLKGKEENQRMDYLRFLMKVVEVFKARENSFFIFEDLEEHKSLLQTNNIPLSNDTTFPRDSRHRYLYDLNQKDNTLEKNKAFIPIFIQDNTNHLDIVSTLLLSGILSRKDLNTVTSQDLTYLETLLIALSQNIHLDLTKESLKALEDFDRARLALYQSMAIKSRTLKDLNTYLRDCLKAMRAVWVGA
jgi:hypothetical protein